MTIPTITDDLIAEIEEEFRHAYERNSVPDVSPEEGLDLIAHIRQLEKDAARLRRFIERAHIACENPTRPRQQVGEILASAMQATQ